MRRLLLTLCVLIAALLSGRTAPHYPATTYAADAYCASHPNEVKFVRLLNEYRQAYNLPPLVFSRSLSWAAANHAVYMSRTDDIDHTLGTLAWSQNIYNYGYPAGYGIGENVLAGRQSASGALSLWKTSPAHNANMLDPNWKAIGVGRAVNLNGKYDFYWATDFGTVRHRTFTCPSS